MATTVTDVLNIWNDLGVFSYVIPFLLIFAIIFAVLDKSKILGENKTIGSIVAASIGLLSLQFDFVSEFFAVIFPRFGIGISIFIVGLIMLGFFYPADKDGKFSGKVAWIGWTVAIGVILWSLSAWDEWSGQSGFGGFFVENIWSIIVLSVLVTIIIVTAKSGKKSSSSSSTS